MIKQILSCSLVLSCVVGIQAQSNSIESKRLTVMNRTDVKVETVNLPDHLIKQLTVLQEMIGFEQPYSISKDGVSSEKFRIVLKRISQAKPEKKIEQKHGGGKVFVSSVSHRTWFPCIEFLDQKYVFTEGDKLNVDQEMFNYFLKQIRFSPAHNNVERVTNLFLKTQGYLGSDGKKIVRKLADLPISERKRLNDFRKILSKKLSDPKIVFSQDSYLVKMFTWEALDKQILEWQFKFDTNSEIDVTKIVLKKR